MCGGGRQSRRVHALQEAQGLCLFSPSFWGSVSERALTVFLCFSLMSFPLFPVLLSACSLPLFGRAYWYWYSSVASSVPPLRPSRSYVRYPRDLCVWCSRARLPSPSASVTCSSPVPLFIVSCWSRDGMTARVPLRVCRSGFARPLVCAYR